MKLKREFDVDGKKKYWALIPEDTRECGICHLISKEYPDLFKFDSELVLGGLKVEVSLKINNIEKLE